MDIRTDWQDNEIVKAADINRIEGNVKENKTALDQTDKDLEKVSRYFSDNEVYAPKGTLSQMSDIDTILGNRNGILISELGNTFNPTAKAYYTMYVNRYIGVTTITAISTDKDIYIGADINYVWQGWKKCVNDSQMVNNFTTTKTGFIADARTVKSLNDNITTIKNEYVYKDSFSLRANAGGQLYIYPKTHFRHALCLIRIVSSSNFSYSYTGVLYTNYGSANNVTTIAKDSGVDTCSITTSGGEPVIIPTVPAIASTTASVEITLLINAVQ